MLLTHSPLTHPRVDAFDLHVLSTPPAFILSQDQTLRRKVLQPPGRLSCFLLYCSRHVLRTGLAQSFASLRSSAFSVLSSAFLGPMRLDPENHAARST